MQPFLLAVLLAGGMARAGPEALILTPSGLGPVRMGMTIDEAARALGAPLRPRTADAPAGCWITRRADGRDPGIAYMVVEGRIRRIDVQQEKRRAPEVMTREGVGIGTPEAAVVRTYGARLRREPHPYTGRDGGHSLIVAAAGSEGGLVFETYGGRVTRFRAGWRPELGYVEGCT